MALSLVHRSIDEETSLGVQKFRTHLCHDFHVQAMCRLQYRDASLGQQQMEKFLSNREGKRRTET